ncbi:hypothetical protein ACI65C_013240 [Semiaphis heraclei]
MEPTSVVINECVGPLSEAAKATLPNNSTLKKTIRRKRQEIQMAPHNPVDLTTLDIPPAYTMYSPSNGNEEIFLQSDSGPGSNRILIFSRSKSLDILENSSVWYMDDNIIMARNVAKVLSGSDCETQNNNCDNDEEINTCKRKKKKNSKYQQESEDEIISTSETKLKSYENSHMKSCIGNYEHNNTENILDHDIACIIENAIKKATKPILTQLTILQKTLDKVIANQQITDQKIKLLCASNKKMRPISCPIQKLPSSLEGIFPVQNNINYLRHQIMVKNPNVEKVTSCRATVSCLEALITKQLTMQYTFKGKGRRLNFHDTLFYYLTKQATSGFRTTDEEEIKFECTVENFVKHAKRDVKKEKEKGKINNEENANND